MRRRTYRNILIVAILAILIAVGIAGISIYQKYRSQPVSNASQDVASEVIADGLPADSYFEISFFDVGEGDSTLVCCDGQTMLVDGGSPESSSFLYTYLKYHGIDYLDYIVCTHAHLCY